MIPPQIAVSLGLFFILGCLVMLARCEDQEKEFKRREYENWIRINRKPL